MDKIDRKIMCQLDENCREPLSRVSRKLRIGRNVAAYRINKLESEGIISKYITHINLGALGYTTYKIYFKLQHAKSNPEKEFVKALLESKQVIHFLKTEGAFDYTSTIAVKSIKELDEFITNIKGNFSDLIKDYFISLVVYSKIFKLNKLLLGTKQTVPKFEKYSEEIKEIKLDNKDKKILKTLSQSANIPLIDLAKKTGLTVDIVKYRLSRLNKDLAIAYRVIHNFNKLEYYHYVIMLKIRHAAKHDEAKLVAWCADRQNVLYCTKRIGLFDFEINAAITDINNLNEFLSDLKKEFGNIIDSYELIINSDLLKLDYFPF